MKANVFGLASVVADSVAKGAFGQAAGEAVAGAFELSAADQAFLKGPYLPRPAACLAHERLRELAQGTRRPTWQERMHLVRCTVCSMALSGPK